MQSKAFIALVEDSIHINVHELEPLLVIFHLWSPNWQQSKVIIYTDNAIALNSLTNFSLRGLANKPLCEILLLEAKYDVAIEAC